MRDPKAIQATIEFYSRHLVALCAAIKSRSEGANAHEQFRANCGFLLKVRDKIFLVTAGHILKQWNDGFNHPDVEVTGSWLWGSFKSGSNRTQQIPFDFKRCKQVLMFDKSRGLDFGAIELSDEYVSQLVAKNVVTIGDEGLPSIDEQFDSFLMVGLPTKSIEGDTQHATLSPAVMGLIRADLPSDRRYIEFKEFAAQLGRNLSLDGPDNIDGMSGGLVFGIRRQGAERRYWPFAIQSWCRPDEGLAFACPIRNFAEQIAIEIDKADAEQPE
jgi:hypothetical protein